ncbi:MAG: DUF4330 domain-containing protein [Caldisericia bacterium]|nr:DUF4330 domain-containing protein [Caldisericia bacterium]
MEREHRGLKNFKLFGLFNLFDIVVFLLIIIVLFYFIRPLFVKKQVSYKDYIITVKLLEVPPEMANSVKKGDRIVDKSGRVFGKILEDPQIEPSKKWVETSDGRVVIAEQPVLKDIIIKFSFRSTSLKYGTDVFKIGYELVIESDLWALKGVVLSIN